LERHAGVFKSFIGDFHCDALFWVQRNGLGGGYTEESCVKYIRILLEQIYSFDW
jgi:hypothetical protein